MKISAPIVLILSAAALAGCSEAKSVATPTASQAPSPTPSTPPTPAGPATMQIGQTYASPDGVIRTTAHGYRQPTATNGPGPDQDNAEWGALDVEMCALTLQRGGEGISVTDEPWALYQADNGMLRASGTTWGHFPVPEYPKIPKIVPTGRCVRGWIVFAVPKGQKVVRAEYAPGGRPLVEWVLAR